jgi:hypothetical protein
MTKDYRLGALLKKVKDIKQYGFSGTTSETGLLVGLV